ncbi:MAG TPA: thioesterase family protein [Dermatophilaceae bacterium]|nr:thioesterase family protein [Dermatophilaceae bacterium]
MSESESEFDQAIALQPGAEPGAYEGALGAGWRIGGGINGGVLLALAGHALSHEFAAEGHPDPLAISAYYLTPGVPGPAQVRTEVHRRGRAVSVGSAALSQPDGEADREPGGDAGRGAAREMGSDAGRGAAVERIRVLATYGDLSGVGADLRTSASPPSLPPIEHCVTTADAPPTFLQHASLLERLDIRLDPATTGWAVGKPSGNGAIRGWLRMADGREPDPMLLLLAVDALPPVAFDLGLPGWTPTLELTAHVRCRPARGWLRINVTSRTLSGGLMEEDAEVWDSEGRLVALSRQLARASAPPRSRADAGGR